jgi:predicted XRE-type DNA-binding protein
MTPIWVNITLSRTELLATEVKAAYHNRLTIKSGMSKKNVGSSLDDFLQVDSSLSSTTALAIKKKIAWQITEEMKAQNLTKTELVKRMQTSRSALNRLLDKNDRVRLSCGAEAIKHRGL